MLFDVIKLAPNVRDQTANRTGKGGNGDEGAAGAIGRLKGRQEHSASGLSDPALGNRRHDNVFERVAVEIFFRRDEGRVRPEQTDRDRASAVFHLALHCLRRALEPDLRSMAGSSW